MDVELTRGTVAFLGARRTAWAIALAALAWTGASVPAAARRIRDAIAERIDAKYAAAVADLAAHRRALLDGGQRDRWREATESLVGDDFTVAVESGRYGERVAQ